LSLAVLLSELALACPISAIQGDRSIRFIAHTGATTPQGSLSVSAPELISMVYRATSRYYRSAVKHCLNQDDVASAAARLNAAPYQYSPSRFYTKVILNLNRHYQPLRQHNVRHSARYEHLKNHAEIASLRHVTHSSFRTSPSRQGTGLWCSTAAKVVQFLRLSTLHVETRMKMKPKMPPKSKFVPG
jgi:hypothetical protein